MNQQWKRRIILFLAGQTVSLFGSSIVQYAINWHITLTTQSGLMLTIATLCGFLPQVLISLFAGVWADRYNRKMLIMLADGMIAVCTLILAILFMMGHTNILLLFFISAVRSIGTGIQMPAVNALLPELVPGDNLMRVNGLNASINSIMMLLAPAIAGGLYSLTELNVIFWIDVTTAAIGISLLAILKIPFEKKMSDPPHVLQDMFGGLNYVGANHWLKQLILFYLFFALMIGPAVFLTPLMVARSFGPESWRLAVHEMVFSVGGIIGGLSIGIIAKKISNQVHILIAACFVFGLTTFIMGFSPNFAFYLGVMVPTGISMPFINTSFMTLIQTKVKPELLGRVFGLVTIVGSSAMPLSTVVFGPLADRVSVELLLIITGAAMMLISLLVIRFKEIMAIGKV